MSVLEEVPDLFSSLWAIMVSVDPDLLLREQQMQAPMLI